MRWDILTGEYPPELGGVADHTWQVAGALASAGDEVHVWTAARAREPRVQGGVVANTLPGIFGLRALRELSRQLSNHEQRAVFVQYVPQAYGLHGANVLFCLWLRWRRAKQRTWTLFHEVEVPFDRKRGLKWNLLAMVTRVMAWLVAHGSERIYVTIPAWKHLLPSSSPAAEWLPAPSNLPLQVDSERVRELREELAGTAELIGHFSTYTRLIAPLIVPWAGAILENGVDRVMVFMGNNAGQYSMELGQRFPALASRIRVAEGLSNEDLALHVAACDVMLQPYPDGITARRSTTMASLALGKPVVTNLGHHSEEFWATSEAVVLVDRDDADAACAAVGQLDAYARLRVGNAARDLYAERFALERAVAKLRSDAATTLWRTDA